MGYYLSHLNNAKENPEANTSPDENYAREIMQLFTIGLYELNADGTQKRDANGELIATFDNTEIETFARLFTGLTYNQSRSIGSGTVNFEEPMMMFEMERSQPSPSIRFYIYRRHVIFAKLFAKFASARIYASAFRASYPMTEIFAESQK